MGFELSLLGAISLSAGSSSSGFSSISLGCVALGFSTAGAGSRFMDYPHAYLAMAWASAPMVGLFIFGIGLTRRFRAVEFPSRVLRF